MKCFHKRKEDSVIRFLLVKNLSFHRYLMVDYIELNDQAQDLTGLYVDSNEEYQLRIQTNRLIDQNDI